MNLSTSSFRQELKVIAVVVLLLALAEVGLRFFEHKLSLDIATIQTFPDIARRLAEGQGTKILFFGNSMTREGVNEAVIKTDFLQAAIPVTLERSFADDTIILDWYAIFQHFYKTTAPHILVVGFAGSNLEDLPIRAEQPRRIGRYFSSWADTPELFRNDLTTLGQRTEYLLSRVLVSFANRERVRKRLLATIIPNYQTFANDLNTAQSNTQANLGEHSYTRLQRFITLASSHGSKLVFVAMPHRELYTLDPLLLSTLTAQNADFIDARNIPGLAKENFADDLHLNQEGAKLYSHYLASQLVQRVAGQ